MTTELNNGVRERKDSKHVKRKKECAWNIQDKRIAKHEMTQAQN